VHASDGNCPASVPSSIPSTRRHGTAEVHGEPAWFQMLRAHVRAVLANDRAVRLFREGRLGEAIATLQRGLEANPPYATGYSNLGFLYLCQGQLDQATACLLHALEVDPRHPDAPDHLVDVLRGLIDELVQIGFNEGFLALHPGAHFDHHHRHLRAREIGKLIATIGARGVLKVTGRPIQTMELLQLVIYRVQQQLCDHRQAVNLALAWEELERSL